MPHVTVAAPEGASGTPSIAVLPFLNMSSDAEFEYFADGITEDIIIELSRFRSLCVIARTRPLFTRQLDPHDSRTHLMLAWSYLNVKGDFDLARIQIDEALTLNPNDYYNYCFGGWLNACSGNLGHAVACSTEALRRSPVVSDDCLEARLVAEYLDKNYQGSIMAFGRMVHPRLSPFAWTAAAYAQLGRIEEARAMVDVFLNGVVELPWAPQADDPDGWHPYWAEEFPTKDSAAREHLFDGLRKAGLFV